ncbi:aspartyl-phosphate phosphatase Spo0E family protein [Bacillus sp. F19]|nr:aspartyl-phosphate phosphatase Spo0E family protein [Bacillus sp. F19]
MIEISPLNDNEELINEINLLRENMIEAANYYGFTSPKTLKWSEKLDRLLYKYQSITKEPDPNNRVNGMENVTCNGSIIRLKKYYSLF